MGAVIALLSALGAEAPTEATVVYYNARMALREDESLEAVKLWLLRNALEDHTGKISAHDDDFRSVAWVALGDLGVCQDGLASDEDGAGLWPLAMHNWVVKNRNRRSVPKKPSPFKAFEAGRQQRFISVREVLGADELKTVRLIPTRCLRPKVAMTRAGLPVLAELTDKETAARLLEHLLKTSFDTVVTDGVRGRAAVEARLFDVQLQLAEIAERKARQAAREDARRGRQNGLSRGSVRAIRDDGPAFDFPPGSEAERILQTCVDWSISEWMSLSHDRRLFLFDQAERAGADSAALDRVAFGVIDALTADDEGREVARWIGMRANRQRAIWSGARGERLLALDAESGFEERGVIALHRGVEQLERGALTDAMRSFSYAIQLSPESRAGNNVRGLALRWLTYLTAQFEISDSLLITLSELVPKREYGVILEDLMWRAAFHADTSSFERGLRNRKGRGAMERRMVRLESLARGDLAAFGEETREGMASTPSETLRFLSQFIERIEREDAEVRTDHVPTLHNLREVLDPIADGPTGRQARRASELLARTGAILEGLGALGEDASLRDRARSLSPDGEVFAGSVRLAPSDALPWPFREPEVSAPSIFTPLDLRPVEWRAADGSLVFGWEIAG